jgi:alpha-D-xyloside xylohydrolase
MMRALMMDFANDKDALDLNNEYMFGKSLLVCPVTTPMYTKINVQDKDTINIEDFSVVKNQQVYLPEGVDWYDFWTGEKYSGGHVVSKETPIDIIPVYVKAGSILPIGPEVQYTTEKEWDNLEIRIYPGADGEFTLYEDEDDNYNYEKGIYSTITFIWDEEQKVLTINDRKGGFSGMLKERSFGIVIVTAETGTGMDHAKKYYQKVIYEGKKIMVNLQ